ncbi:MAG: hypothetical protein IT267_12430 [Saprospiraceae bacterium]|nr:hypothetical protein [Saprospiraceae bacterium]
MNNNTTIIDLISSGILEQYVIGNLSIDETRKIAQLETEYPALKIEIDRIINVMLETQASQELTQNLKSKVLVKLKDAFVKKVINLNNPENINIHSDISEWIEAVNELKPQITNENYSICPFFKNELKEMSLVWLHGSLLEEEHESTEFKESFLILEGECECNFEGIIVRFKAGDYFEVPVKTKHLIKNITTQGSSVKGIVQRLAS